MPIFCDSVDRHRCPSLAVLVGNVNEQSVLVCSTRTRCSGLPSSCKPRTARPRAGTPTKECPAPTTADWLWHALAVAVGHGTSSKEDTRFVAPNREGALGVGRLGVESAATMLVQLAVQLTHRAGSASRVIPPDPAPSRPLSAPAIDKHRYHSVMLNDGNTFNYGYIGSRATGNEPGDYLIAGPRWQGETPPGSRRYSGRPPTSPLPPSAPALQPGRHGQRD